MTMPFWTRINDPRNPATNGKPAHQHEGDTVLGVTYTNQPGKVECPRCGDKIEAPKRAPKQKK